LIAAQLTLFAHIHMTCVFKVFKVMLLPSSSEAFIFPSPNKKPKY